MENATNIELIPTPAKKSQVSLITELNALEEVRRLAEIAVENKMREMAQELGSTFQHEGGCHTYPDAKVLQIRVRFNKKKQRDVPFFVPLEDFPSSWLSGPRKKVVLPEPDTAPVAIVPVSTQQELQIPMDTEMLVPEGEFNGDDGIVVS